MVRKTAVTSAIAALIVSVAGFAWAQSTQPPFIQLQHLGPPKEAPAPGHFKSVADIPVQPAEASGQVSRLNVITPSGNAAHIMPTVQQARLRAKLIPSAIVTGTNKAECGIFGCGSPPLAYQGGLIMSPYISVYPIYWAPGKLQGGEASGFSAKYSTVTILAGAWLPGHELEAIAAQYYQTVSSVTTYVNNGGGLGGFYVDRTALPAAGCSYTNGPVTDSKNCITDAQIQAEIKSVMTTNGWTGGMNKIFLLFTSSGEGSCFDNTASSCAYQNYCAYHSSFTFNGQTVIYGNEPYGNSTADCTSLSSFPNDPDGDTASSAEVHEMTEAATDPNVGSGWVDGVGNEIGDMCAYDYGPLSPLPWDSGLANHMWNGMYFVTQTMFDNNSWSYQNAGHTITNWGCLLAGPY